MYGSITPSGGGSTFSISQGKMDANKTIASFVFTDGNYRNIVIAIKADITSAASDFDGDGISDIVVFRSGAWLFHNFATGVQTSGVWTGSSPACIPAPMDYSGDGKVKFTQLCNGPWHFHDDDGSYNKGIWTGGVVGDQAITGVTATFGGSLPGSPVIFQAPAVLPPAAVGVPYSFSFCNPLPAGPLDLCRGPLILQRVLPQDSRLTILYLIRESAFHHLESVYI
jgi:hypothetical protein